jgi:prepilin peptidase CpaA
MSWVVNIILVLEVLLLLTVAAADIAARTIRNEVCLALAILGIVGQLDNPSQIAQSLIVAAILFALLLLIYARGWMGGGDVKLLVAVAIGLPVPGVFQLLTITALAGGGLAMVHLVMRLLPSPSLAAAPRLCGWALASSTTRSASLWCRHRLRRHLVGLEQRILICHPPCGFRSLWCCCWQARRWD